MLFYQHEYILFIVVVTVVLCLNHLKFGKGFQTCQHTRINTMRQDGTVLFGKTYGFKI